MWVYACDDRRPAASVFEPTHIEGAGRLSGEGEMAATARALRGRVGEKSAIEREVNARPVADGQRHGDSAPRPACQA